MAVAVDVQGGSVVGEVGEDDTDVDGAGEEAGAKTSNGCRGDFGDVDWSSNKSETLKKPDKQIGLSSPYNRRLADTEASDEAASIDGAQVSIDTSNHEDDDADDPERAEDAGCLDSTDPIANQEGTVGKPSSA